MKCLLAGVKENVRKHLQKEKEDLVINKEGCLLLNRNQERHTNAVCLDRLSVCHLKYSI